MYSEGKPTQETKRAYVALEEEGRRYEGARQGESIGRGRDYGGGEGQMRALEHEENLSVIRQTLYSGKLYPPLLQDVDSDVHLT